MAALLEPIVAHLPVSNCSRADPVALLSWKAACTLFSSCIGKLLAYPDSSLEGQACVFEPVQEDHNAAAQDASTAQEHDQSMSPPVFREQHHMQQQGHDGPQHSSLAANLPLESDNVCSGSPQHVESQQQTPGPWVLSSSMPPAEQSQGGQRQQEVRMHSYAEAPACAAASGAPFSEGSHWAGAAQSMQPDVQNPSTAIQKIGEQLQEQAEVLSDDSDSEDDIQVRPMNKHALLSSLMGSGGAEDAIESFVASLKY